MAETTVHEITSKLELLNLALEETKYKINEEQLTQHSYEHVLKRMKKDFIAAKIQSSENDAALKNKSNILDME